MGKRNNKKNENTFISYIFLAFLVIGLICFFVYNEIKENYAQNEPKILEIKKKLQIIHPSVSQLKFYAADKSYTINKHKIHLCLKDENGNYYDENMLIYVALHELAHVLCDEIGHTNKFKEIFKNLLIEAEDKQIYDSNIPPILNYCNYND